MRDPQQQHYAWLALMARLWAPAQDPDGSPSAFHLELECIEAAAGRLRHHQERAANDLEAATLIWLLFLYWTYANYCANLSDFRAVSRKTHPPAVIAESSTPTRVAALLWLLWLGDKTITSPQGSRNGNALKNNSCR